MAGEDIFGQVGGVIGGINGGMGSSLLTTIFALQVPMAIIFTVLSGILLYLFFLQNWVIQIPKIPFIWRWIGYTFKYKVTLVRPFADGKVAAYQDLGGLVNAAGITRFKLKTENVVMQKPETTDVYSNMEIIVVSLGPTRKLNATRKIDYAAHTITFDVENPKTAQQYFVDVVQSRSPDYLLRKLSESLLLVLLWFFSGLILVGANFLIIYPLYVKALYLGGGLG